MQAFVLIGEKKTWEDYLSGFVVERNIPSYLCLRFGPKVKIEEARIIKKTLTTKLHPGENRLVVLESPVNLEAQNALLKTIEELPPHTFLFLLVRNIFELVPTVVSRCQVISLKNEEKFVSESLRERKRRLTLVIKLAEKRNNPAFILSFLEELDQKEELDLNSFLELIKDDLFLCTTEKEQNRKYLLLLCSIAWDLLRFYPYTQSNVKDRFILENTLLTNLEKYVYT